VGGERAKRENAAGQGFEVIKASAKEGKKGNQQRIKLVDD